MEGGEKVILATDVRLVIVLFAYLQNCATFFFFFQICGKALGNNNWIRTFFDLSFNIRTQETI